MTLLLIGSSDEKTKLVTDFEAESKKEVEEQKSPEKKSEVKLFPIMC